MTALYNPAEFSTPSQRQAAAARGARLHRFSSAACMPVGERLPGPAFVKTMEPVPNSAIAEAAEIAFPRLIMNRVEAIQIAVLTEYPTVSMYDLKSDRRKAIMVRARQIAMYMAKVLTARSLPEIGRRFGEGITPRFCMPCGRLSDWLERTLYCVSRSSASRKPFRRWHHEPLRNHHRPIAIPADQAR